jgi:hypothetical protein
LRRGPFTGGSRVAAVDLAVLLSEALHQRDRSEHCALEMVQCCTGIIGCRQVLSFQLHAVSGSIAFADGVSAVTPIRDAELIGAVRPDCGATFLRKWLIAHANFEDKPAGIRAALRRVARVLQLK